MEPWYLSLKYLVEESPNTSAITKWLIGFAQNQSSFSLDEIIDGCEVVDSSRLQNSIVNNVFEMTYNEVSGLEIVITFVIECDRGNFFVFS